MSRRTGAKTNEVDPRANLRSLIEETVDQVAGTYNGLNESNISEGGRREIKDHLVRYVNTCFQKIFRQAKREVEKDRAEENQITVPTVRRALKRMEAPGWASSMFVAAGIAFGSGIGVLRDAFGQDWPVQPTVWSSLLLLGAFLLYAVVTYVLRNRGIEPPPLP